MKNTLLISLFAIIFVNFVNAEDTKINYMPERKIETRWLTGENPKGLKGAAGKKRHGRKGAPVIGIPAGGELIITDIKGSGTIRRIWGTLTSFEPEVLRSLVIEMYWDGAEKPAVLAPFPDFFGHTFGEMATFENIFFSSPKATSFNCIIPMSFKKSAKIVVKNESKLNLGMFYEVDVTLGEKHNKNMLYFHSYWRRENYTKLREDFTILPEVKGRGKFLGCNLGFHSNSNLVQSWWGEGEVKIYLDGDTNLPTLCGTGTEDYIGSGFGQDYFSHLYQGNQFVSNPDTYFKNAHGFYRFHVPDPVYFYEDIRVTIQVIGGPGYTDMLRFLEKDPNFKLMKAGNGKEYYTKKELEDALKKNPKASGYLERIDDWCATAYWYMDKPSNCLPKLAPLKERTENLPMPKKCL